jgi:hypothetical protein
LSNTTGELVEQELLTLPEHLSSPPVFSGVHVAQSLVFFVVYIFVCPFVFFLLGIVLYMSWERINLVL